jgi:hypothetical protein
VSKPGEELARQMQAREKAEKAARGRAKSAKHMAAMKARGQEELEEERALQARLKEETRARHPEWFR